MAGRVSFEMHIKIHCCGLTNPLLPAAEMIKRLVQKQGLNCHKEIPA